MTTPASTRGRTVALLAAVLMAALALAGCSSPQSASQTKQDSSAAEGEFPVTLEHKFGSTTIDRAPARVVVVGLNEQDALLALGVVPVAVSEWKLGNAPGRIYPWAEEYLGDAPLPEVLDNSDGVQLEQIAALEPDLIIGEYAGLTEKEYKELSKIAPTVAQPAGYADWGVPWDEATINIGRAVGKQVEAKKLVDSVNDAIEQTAAENAASFAGHTGVAVAAWEGIFVYGPQDPRGRLLAQLGLEFPVALEQEGADQWGWSFSAEQIGLLSDVDVIDWGSPEEEIDQEFGRAWTSTTAAKEDRAIYSLDGEPDIYVTASNFMTPLSIPYYLKRYVPKLVAALDGDPATQIPAVVE